MTASIFLFALGAAAVPTIAGGGEASKSAKAILTDMQRDLSKVKSFHFDGRMTDPSGVTRISGDVFASGSANLGIVQGGASVRMILLPKSTFLKANARYWRDAGGVADRGVVAKLAGRWVKVPGSVRSTVQSLLAELTPKHLASCVFAGTGTLSNKGIKTLGGRKVIVVEGKSDRPGATPGLVYIAADGPVLPVRQVQTGPRRAGGKLDKRCEEPNDKSTSSDVTFSQYDRVSRLRAPRDVLSLENPGTTA